MGGSDLGPVRAHGPIMATQLDDEGKPVGEPFEFATGGIVSETRIVRDTPRQARTRWVSRPDPDPVELTLKLTPNWPSFSRVLGVPGCRDEVDYRLASRVSLSEVRGTAAWGTRLGREVRLGYVYEPASVREERFFRAAIEARGLRLFKLSVLPGDHYYVCTPHVYYRALLREIVRKFSDIGERWHVEPLGSTRLRTPERQAELFERLRDRPIRPQPPVDLHAWGLAIDVNWKDNPYVRQPDGEQRDV